MEILSNMEGNETSDAKEKRKAELFEKERKERLMKLDEWKVSKVMPYFLYQWIPKMFLPIDA